MRRICRVVSVHNVHWLDVPGGKTNTEVFQCRIMLDTCVAENDVICSVSVSRR